MCVTYIYKLNIIYKIFKYNIRTEKNPTKLGCKIAGLLSCLKVCKMYQDSLTGSDPLQTNVYYYLSSHLVLGMQAFPLLSS